MTMLTINDLPAFSELDTREMSAVRGGLCVDMAQAIREGNKDSGVNGAIAAVASCLDLIGHRLPVCPA
jgi:hypothetical protein